MKAYCAYHFTIFPAHKLEIVSAWLSHFPFESFVEHEGFVTAYISKEEAHKIVLSDCLDVPYENVKVSASVEDIDGQNWNSVWEAQFKPIRVGDWIIRASFHAHEKATHELIIDPQMSFGTGHHATTQLMLSQVLQLSCNKKTVLDVGTGTGVLAILAKKLGAANVFGIDIEDWCVENAKENALKNGVSDINFSLDELSSFQTKFDIIIANINRNVLIQHLPKYAKLLNGNGVILLSGFHEKDIAILKELAHTHGLRCENETEKEDWICLKFLLS